MLWYHWLLACATIYGLLGLSVGVCVIYATRHDKSNPVLAKEVKENYIYFLLTAMLFGVPGIVVAVSWWASDRITGKHRG